MGASIRTHGLAELKLEIWVKGRQAIRNLRSQTLGEGEVLYPERVLEYCRNSS